MDLPVTAIMFDSFYECTRLTSVVIPDSVTSIGNSAFYGCTRLTSVVIPDSVTSINVQTFFECTKLTSVKIGNSVTSIGDHAFNGCTSLTSIEIPNSVTNIGSSAFFGCTSLTGVTIPDSVTSIGDLAFFNCNSLTSITVDESNANYKDIDGKLYNKDGTTLIQYTIGKTATSLTIPDLVTNIGDYAFYDCYYLTSVVIPDSVISIGDYAFGDCSKLTCINFNGTIKEWEAIEKGNNWDSNVPAMEIICKGETMAYSEGLKYTLSSDGTYYSVTGIGTCKDTDIIIPETYKDLPVTTIGDSAFNECTSLTSVVIPDSVASIDFEAFRFV